MRKCVQNRWKWRMPVVGRSGTWGVRLAAGVSRLGIWHFRCEVVW